MRGDAFKTVLQVTISFELATRLKVMADKEGIRVVDLTRNILAAAAVTDEMEERDNAK